MSFLLCLLLKMVPKCSTSMHNATVTWWSGGPVGSRSFTWIGAYSRDSQAVSVRVQSVATRTGLMCDYSVVHSSQSSLCK